MYIVLDNIDIIKIEDFRQSVVFNQGVVEERATFQMNDELYTRETVDMLKKYFKTGDGHVYTFALRDEADGENTREFKCNGLVNIEWVAPENSKTGQPFFMASAQELVF